MEQAAYAMQALLYLGITALPVGALCQTVRLAHLQQFVVPVQQATSSTQQAFVRPAQAQFQAAFRVRPHRHAQHVMSLPNLA